MDDQTTPPEGQPGARRALPPLGGDGAAGGSRFADPDTSRFAEPDTTRPVESTQVNPAEDAFPPPYETPQDSPQPARAASSDADEDSTDGQGQPRVLGGRYKLDGVIGRGGMAQVFRAQDTRLGRPVAVKELRSDLASDPTFQARFRREAQSAAGLNHPNIVSVYDTGESIDPSTGLGVPWIVMELVEGHTLRQLLREGRKILPERALELIQGVLDALSYSHRAGIVHRDIKPANVMLTPTGQVKVMDFGIARAVADTQATITQTAAVIGTAQYLSPEQARGETVDNRSDIYSAGCLLYELLINRPPFQGDSPLSVAYQHVREDPVAPSQLDDVITPDIDAITLKALAKDPADRYQDAREMRDDISRLLQGQEVTAPLPVTTPVPVAAAAATPPDATEIADFDGEEDEEEPEKKRRALPIFMVVLAVLAVSGLIATSLWFMNRPEEPEVVMLPVPRVLGESQTSAENTIRNAGFEPKTVEEAGPDDTTVGSVIKQNPGDGQQAEEGSVVTLTVNRGPDKITIPEGLVGLSRSEAEERLRDAGFTNVQARESADEPSDSEPDEVLAVHPGSGESVVPDAEVTLEYAIGKSPVPDWMGWNRESIEEDAQQRGFTNVQFTEQVVANSADVGVAVYSDPEPGTMVERGTTITISIGKAAPQPEQTAPPSSASPSPSQTPSPSQSAPSDGAPSSKPSSKPNGGAGNSNAGPGNNNGNNSRGGQ